MRQLLRGRQRLSGCVARTDVPVFMCERGGWGHWVVVYYESIKRELKIRCICECRCDERLQSKIKEFTRLAYTGLVVELEHLKIETRLINEKFANAMAMGEYVT
jgi:hypothetical protein